MRFYLIFLPLFWFKLRCRRRFPPGNEIYRKDKYSFFEVDGSLQRVGSFNKFLFNHNLNGVKRLKTKKKHSRSGATLVRTRNRSRLASSQILSLLS